MKGDGSPPRKEKYQTDTGVWSLNAPLNIARTGHSATLLPNGMVLVAGGSGGGTVLSSTELFFEAPDFSLENPAILADGMFRFEFKNATGISVNVAGTTNLTLPQSNWTTLGTATELAPGQYEFVDLQATNHPQRFYRAQSN